MRDSDKLGRKKTTAFIDPELHQAVKIKIAKTPGASIQNVITGLLREWVGGARQVTPEPEAGSSRYRDDLERLIRVLESGTSEDRSLVRGLIKRCDETILRIPEPPPTRAPRR